MRSPIAKILTAAAVVTLAACASAPEPTERLASAQASVRAARELHATNIPRAELHVRLAEEQVQSARKLMEDGENHRADMLLRRAKADAELALALTRHHAAMSSAKTQREETIEEQKDQDRVNDVSGSPESALPPSDEPGPTTKAEPLGSPQRMSSQGALAPRPDPKPEIVHAY